MFCRICCRHIAAV
ncbi:MAG: hypothetical protein LBD59_11985 [Prevotellaceae bacterium]|nr:hypothetical protein [Prevotellaceae bacterium]